MCYSSHISSHPISIIIISLLLSSILILSSLFLRDLPSFDDPLLGFESRNTLISKRINTWKLLVESTSWNGILSMHPNGVDGKKKVDEKLRVDGNNVSFGLRDSVRSKSERDDEKEEEEVIGEMAKEHRLTNHVSDKQMFCNKLLPDYAHFVVANNNDANNGHNRAHNDFNDLFSYESIKSICRIDKLLRLEHDQSSSTIFESICEHKSRGVCCPSWSLANYVAFAANKSSCVDITKDDVIKLKNLVQSCSSYYHDMHLTSECQDDPQLCNRAPLKCFQYGNAVFNIMHYLVDFNFLQFTSSSPSSYSSFNNIHVRDHVNSKVRYSSLFLPIAKSTKLLTYFSQLSNVQLVDEHITVIGMDLGLKYALLDKFLIKDASYLILATLAILFLLTIYTHSVLITLMTVLIIISSLATSYFFYMIVFDLPIFPFINLLAIVIAIGIGSDNALIYCKVWACAKKDKTCVIFIKLVKDTLSHTFISLFAASATTCAAFYATYFSDITAIKCFSIFAGTSVVSNFVFTILLLPPAIVISEKSSFDYLFLFPSCWKLQTHFSNLAKNFFENLLFLAIIKLRYFWLLLFTSISLSSILIVTYAPKLLLPESAEFQIFRSSHPFEQYDFHLKDQFWFNRDTSNGDSQVLNMPIRVVFGVSPIDNGDILNPAKRGTLEFVKDFDVATPEAQQWLLQFCRELRNQNFYKQTIGPMLPNCFIETFKSWMEDRRCDDGINLNVNRFPCCNASIFPYKKEVFNFCLYQVIKLLDKTPIYSFGLNWAGPRFDKKTSKTVAVVIEYDSNYTFSHSYSMMNQFWKQTDEWISSKIASAPQEMRGGWFVSSNMEFFSLQQSLSQGTIIAIAFAIAFAFIALVLITWNVILSILAIVTITSIIFTTIAILILMDWKLNIVESICISLAIGMAIDLTLHYTIAYKLSMQNDRIKSVQFSLCRIGSSISMSALTTIVAGLLMLPSSILAYVQIGTFLISLSLMSWLFSNFFHLSLLSLIGPQKLIYKSDPFQYLCSMCEETISETSCSSHSRNSISNPKSHTHSGRKASGVMHTFSSSTISTSSTTNSSGFHQQEQHELEAISI